MRFQHWAAALLTTTSLPASCRSWALGTSGNFATFTIRGASVLVSGRSQAPSPSLSSNSYSRTATGTTPTSTCTRSFNQSRSPPNNRSSIITTSIRLKMTVTDDQVRTIQSDGGEVSMTVHHLQSVGSTQDEARRLLSAGSSSFSASEDDTGSSVEPSKHSCLATSASEQTKGRGTSGRDWIGRGGNTFVTVCVPSSCIVSIPLTLLPLKVGTIVAQLVHERLRKRKAWSKVAVKWPNDVLVDDKKIAGILIENHYDEVTKESWYLVGIGVNVAHAPKIDLAGPQRGRMSTCIADHCEIEGDGVEMAQALAFDIAKGIHDWVAASIGGGEYVDKSIASEAIIREWSDWAEFGKEQVLRDKPGNVVVTPVGIEPDGRLRVRQRNGSEMLLAADYLL